MHPWCAGLLLASEVEVPFIPPDEREPLTWQLRLLWFGVIVAVLAGALFILWVDRWRKRAAAERLSSGNQLSNFRELYEKGELSKEEFDRVRSLLGKRLRKELGVPDKPNKPSGEAEPPEPPAS